MQIRPKKHGKKPAHKNSNRSWHRGLKYWAARGALSTLIACTPLASRPVTFAAAQKTHGACELSALLAQAQAQTQSIRRFDIPPGPLDAVLSAFKISLAGKCWCRTTR